VEWHECVDSQAGRHSTKTIYYFSFFYKYYHHKYCTIYSHSRVYQFVQVPRNAWRWFWYGHHNARVKVILRCSEVCDIRNETTKSSVRSFDLVKNVFYWHLVLGAHHHHCLHRILDVWKVDYVRNSRTHRSVLLEQDCKLHYILGDAILCKNCNVSHSTLFHLLVFSETPPLLGEISRVSCFNLEDWFKS